MTKLFFLVTLVVAFTGSTVAAPTGLNARVRRPNKGAPGMLLMILEQAIHFRCIFGACPPDGTSGGAKMARATLMAREVRMRPSGDERSLIRDACMCSLNPRRSTKDVFSVLVHPIKAARERRGRWLHSWQEKFVFETWRRPSADPDVILCSLSPNPKPSTKDVFSEPALPTKPAEGRKERWLPSWRERFVFETRW
ncbi:hypothetical protein CALVIDRAFT_258297 [Calocera viscosa TUFC12733]|uniref:Secreted protein n=1 Tax=Calocera viscosa (strain TUFC12733) TaxID=1330018 RepID=A0A167J252_CALVF|nr:hypothetical protein CALVIDRAFT_258297 [Calocera viscosa TUFC12733]